MKSEVTIHNDTLVVEIIGSVNRFDAGRLYDVLVACARKGDAKLVVDLEQLSSMTRAGARGLIVAGKLLQTGGGKMRICNANITVEHLIKSLGYRHLLKCLPSREMAFAVMEDAETPRRKASQTDRKEGKLHLFPATDHPTTAMPEKSHKAS